MAPCICWFLYSKYWLEVVMQSGVLCLQGCKVLLVAETKAFFSLYQPISAAGLSAVQLDRSRKLVNSPPATAGCNKIAAGAAAEEWEAAVAAALASGRCVLITHEHLMNPFMPIHMFDALVEYVAAAETAAAASSGNAAGGKSINSSDASKDEVVAKFSGCHYVFNVLSPDLQRAAADIAAAQAAAAAQQVPAAEACSEVWPATAAATGARPSTAAPEAAGRPATARQPELTKPAAAAAVPAAAIQGPQADHATAAHPEQPAAGLKGHEYPLVLNRSPGSLLRQRRSLYEAILQLEEQGYLLVERNLGSVHSNTVSNVAASAAAAGGLCSSAGAAAVDIVVSPVACLCVWGEAKLPQVSAGSRTGECV